MEGYCKLQIKEIKRYIRLLHVTEAEGSLAWVSRGLAKQFAIKHREEFGLTKEAI